jgi:hypothetical protein
LTRAGKKFCGYLAKLTPIQTIKVIAVHIRIGRSTIRHIAVVVTFSEGH